MKLKNFQSFYHVLHGHQMETGLLQQIAKKKIGALESGMFHQQKHKKETK